MIVEVCVGIIMERIWVAKKGGGWGDTARPS